MKLGVIGRGFAARAVAEALQAEHEPPLVLEPEALESAEGAALVDANPGLHWIVLDPLDAAPTRLADDQRATHVALADPPSAGGVRLLRAIERAERRVELPRRGPEGVLPPLVVDLRSGDHGAVLIRRAARAIARSAAAKVPAPIPDAAWPASDPEGRPARARFQDDAAQLCRAARAWSDPFPGLLAQLGALEVRIHALEETAWTGVRNAAPGTLCVDDSGVRVRCRGGAVRVLSARLADQPLDRRAFARVAAAQDTPAFSNDGPALPFGVPTLGTAEERAVVRTLRTRWIGTGPGVAAFEEAFQEATGAKHAVAVSSCTAALHLSLLAAGVGPGDEVITTPLTFVATANAILYTGATPVFADVEAATLNLAPDAVADAIGPKTRAIVPVHFGGRVCNMDALRALARDAGIAIVEDAAHAAGAIEPAGHAVGAGPDDTCFSFYPNKNLTSCEGGIIATASAERARRFRRMRMHGLSADAWKRFGTDEVVRARSTELGFKYNLTDLQAALGRVQVERLERFTEIRNEQALQYAAAFRDCTHFTPLDPQVPGAARHAWHLYTLAVDGLSRDRAQRELRSRGIGAAIHYEPVHLHPFFRERLRYDAGDFPIAEWAGASTLTLPIGPRLGADELERVIDAVHAVDALAPSRRRVDERAGSREGRRVSPRPCPPRPTTSPTG